MKDRSERVGLRERATGNCNFILGVLYLKPECGVSRCLSGEMLHLPTLQTVVIDYMIKHQEM